VDLRPLYDTLRQRRRPEDVAELLLPLLADRLTPAQLATLRQAAAHSLQQSVWQYSAMAQTFRQPIGAARQVQQAAELFQQVPAALRYEAPDEVEAFADPKFLDWQAVRPKQLPH
jgi:hypothetical protein